MHSAIKSKNTRRADRRSATEPLPLAVVAPYSSPLKCRKFFRDPVFFYWKGRPLVREGETDSRLAFRNLHAITGRRIACLAPDNEILSDPRGRPLGSAAKKSAGNPGKNT
ncbi:hypothetical protein Zmor_008028 [Zophobas morio]|uniref:Uncharacterized protein n=1 Tax=Zophobas morio TaxID=2755281 RepID=A0AA38IWV7_9CUCU|nr:hypothetical protein Zmor_008028 [Zophobas morio]